jgi:hypothetical protein
VLHSQDYDYGVNDDVEEIEDVSVAYSQPSSYSQPTSVVAAVVDGGGTPRGAVDDAVDAVDDVIDNDDDDDDYRERKRYRRRNTVARSLTRSRGDATHAATDINVNNVDATDAPP